jgi:hypothetical protein
MIIFHEEFDDFRENGEAGAICVMRNTEDGIAGLSIKCKGCGEESYLPLDDPRHWKLIQENPLTIQPSVFHKTGCGWHGWLKNGEWKSI